MQMPKLSEHWRFFIQLKRQSALPPQLLYQQSASPSIFLFLLKLFQVTVASMLVIFAFVQLPYWPEAIDQVHFAISK
jgi:hypothetical protein